EDQTDREQSTQPQFKQTRNALLVHGHFPCERLNSAGSPSFSPMGNERAAGRLGSSRSPTSTSPCSVGHQGGAVREWLRSGYFRGSADHAESGVEPTGRRVGCKLTPTPQEGVAAYPWVGAPTGDPEVLRPRRGLLCGVFLLQVGPASGRLR